MRLLAACALLATVADLDLLWPQYHRQATHSVTAVLMTLIIAAVVTDRVTRWRVALACAVAYASHLFLDWLAVDTFPPPGIQLLWPLSRRYFISGLDVFLQTERRNLLGRAAMDKNVRAVMREIMVLAPVAAALWLVRVKALARFPAKVPRGDHAAQ